MKRKKVRKAKAITGAGSWIIPSLHKGDSEDVYGLKVMNGTTWTTDFEILSKIDSENFGFFNDGNSAHNWTAVINAVHNQATKQCVIKPGSSNETLEFSIPKIKYRIDFDTKWRIEKNVHKFRL